MAPKPAAYGFLTAKAKTASARVILALAVAAVLALAGCGGGEGGSDVSSTAGTPGSSTSAKAPAGKDKAPPDSSSSGQQSQGTKSADQQPTASGSQASGGKHGQHIKLPKGEPESAPTAAEKEQATIADIALASPDLQSAPGTAATLSAANTCDGNNVSPSLIWQGVPAGTQELALFVMNSQPVEGKLFFDWAVAGLDPSLTSLETNRLPKGAVLGQNSFGKSAYEICPPQGSGETYIFTLYALPRGLNASKGFDPHQLREEILAQSGNAGLMAAGYGG